MDSPHPPEAVLEAFADWLQEWADYTRAYSAWLKGGRKAEDEGAPAGEQAWASPAAGEPPDHWLEAAGSAGPPAHWLALFEQQAEASTATDSLPGGGLDEEVGPLDPEVGALDPSLEQSEARRAEPEQPERTHVQAADHEPSSSAPAPSLNPSDQASAPSQPLPEPPGEAVSAPPESARAADEPLRPGPGGGPEGGPLAIGEMLGRMQRELRALRPTEPASEPPAPGIQAGERQATAFEAQPPQTGEAPAGAPAPAPHSAGPGQPKTGGSPPGPLTPGGRSGRVDRHAADDSDHPAGAFPQAGQLSHPRPPMSPAVTVEAAADPLPQPGRPSDPDVPAPPAKPPAAPRPALRVRRAAPAGEGDSGQPAPRSPAAGKAPQPAAAPPDAGPEAWQASTAPLEAPSSPHPWPAPDGEQPRSAPEEAPAPPHSAPIPQPAAALRPPGPAPARPAGEDAPGAAPVPDVPPSAVAAPPPAAARLTIKTPPAVMPESDGQPEVPAPEKPRRAAQKDAHPPVPDAPLAPDVGPAEQDPVYPVWTQSEAIPPQWPEPTDAHWPDLPAPAAERPPLPRQFQDPLRRQRLDREQGGALWNE